jgi:hypothetical protein
VLVGTGGEEGGAGAAGDEGLSGVVAVGDAGEEGVAGAAGEELAVEVADEEELADELELPVAPFDIAAAVKWVGPRTSDRSCHVESKPDECVSDRDATSV